jgi:adenylate kinase
MLNLILLGGPGAGKGTQALLIRERYELLHLSTGDILRHEVERQTALGKQVQSAIDSGTYVSDDIIAQIISGRIAESKGSKGFIFDGIPRTIPQAQMLDRVLAEHDLEISAVLALEAPEDVLTQRMLSRGKVSNRADDQSEDVCRKRIRTYNEQTKPLIDHYQKQAKHVTVNGIGEIEGIFADICKILDNIK